MRGDRRHIVRQSGRRQTANRPLRSSDHVPFHQGQKEIVKVTPRYRRKISRTI
jgi:hypothetical protein